MSDEMDLSEFLLARIAEDEAAAKAEWDWMIERHGADFWTTGEGAVQDQEWTYETDRDATLHVSPRRVLAECEAKRQIVEHVADQWDQPYGEPEPYIPHDWYRILCLLALPYAGHPDYDEEWRPVTAAA